MGTFQVNQVLLRLFLSPNHVCWDITSLILHIRCDRCGV